MSFDAMRPGCHSLTESNRAKYLDFHQPISRKVRWRVTFGIHSYLMRYKGAGAFGILLVTVGTKGAEMFEIHLSGRIVGIPDK